MLPMTVAGVQVEGVSIAGLETSVWLPQLRVAFDFGRCPPKLQTQQTVLLTHGHVDHVGGMPAYVAARSLNAVPPPTVVLPRALLAHARELLAVHERLGGGELPCDLVPLEVGCPHEVSPTMVVRPFPTAHRVPSQGYVLYQRKTGLLPSLRGLSHEEIRAMSKDGQLVQQVTEMPMVAFTGDTTIDWLLPALQGDNDDKDNNYIDDSGTDGGSHAEASAGGDSSSSSGGREAEVGAANDAGGSSPKQQQQQQQQGKQRKPPQQKAKRLSGRAVVRDALRARLLITECTYVDDRATIERAREVGHTHIDELAAHAHLFRNEAVLLTHFSARYSRQDISGAMQLRLPPGLRERCTPLLQGFR